MTQIMNDSTTQTFKVEPNPANPANWSNERLREWVRDRSRGGIDPDKLCPFESGMQLLRIPETEFIGRILEHHPGHGEKRAKLFYTTLWKLLIESRSKERKTKLRERAYDKEGGEDADNKRPKMSKS